MQRRTMALLVTATAAALVVAAVALRRRTTGAAVSQEPRYGRFTNGIEFASWGDGPKTMLWLPGGPGSELPRGFFARLAARQLRPLIDEGYTVWSLTRRRGMPPGHTIADMADDVAEVIEDRFGRVDLVVGISYGSLIAQCLAARHPSRVGRVVLALSGVRVSDWGRDVDLRWARARADGRMAEAGEVFLESVLPNGRWRRLRHRLGPLAGRMFASEQTSADDLRIEASAEAAFDSRDQLGKLDMPVLLLVAEDDRFFTADIVAETERLIPECTVIRYAGMGHMGAAIRAPIARDIVAWTERRARDE